MEKGWRAPRQAEGWQASVLLDRSIPNGGNQPAWYSRVVILAQNEVVNKVVEINLSLTLSLRRRS